MKLIDRLGRLRLEFVARRHLARGRPAAAIEALTRIRKRFGLSPVQEAELATALLHGGSPEAAQRCFAALQKRMSGEGDERYVQKYCRYYLALMREDRSQAAYEWRLAQTLAATRSLRKRLAMKPVPEKARPGVVATLSLVS